MTAEEKEVAEKEKKEKKSKVGEQESDSYLCYLTFFAANITFELHFPNQAVTKTNKDGRKPHW